MAERVISMSRKPLRRANYAPSGAGPNGSPFEQFEHSGWETFSSAYDEAWGAVTSGFARPLLDSLGVIQGDELLDIATGPGYAASMAKERGAAPVGVDFSRAMVERAREIHPTLLFETADAHDLPFEDGRFDCVVSNFGVQHFVDPARVFSEVARVLKPRGRFAFTLWADNSLNCAGAVLDGALARHASATTAIPTGPDYHELNEEDLRRALLALAGFSPSTVRSRVVTTAWRMDSPDRLFESEISGSVRSGARLREQTPETLAVIRRAMADEIESRYATTEGWALPMAAFVVSARRP
jgi:SAM-dependent methyltransferase